MQIGSGQTPLSLAIMKTLGVESPTASAAGAATASPDPGKAAGPAGKPPAAGVAAASSAASGDASADLGVARTPPRGSFIDLKV